MIKEYYFDQKNFKVKYLEGMCNDSKIKCKSENLVKWDPIELDVREILGFIIPYDGYKIENIKEAIKWIVSLRYGFITGIRFEFDPIPIPGKNYDIRISFKLNGNYSAVGTDARLYDQKKSTMNICEFSVKTVLHEFGHALGLEHEHQGPYSNIPWIKSGTNSIYDYYFNIYRWNKEMVDFNIVNVKSINDVTASEFDPDSIMLYPYPASTTTNGIGSKINGILSPKDVYYLNEIYPITDKYGKKINEDDLLERYNYMYEKYKIPYFPLK